jgi:type VI secretion system protein ImpF
MAKAPELPVVQSVLERLSTTWEMPTSRVESIVFLRDSIRRNLEWLFNSRRSPVAGIEDCAIARHSVLNYGLLDVGSLSLLSNSDQRKLLDNIMTLIKDFEPRLTNVNILLQEEDILNKRFRFHIEAHMQMKPMPEEIAFTTVLDLATGEYEVE